MQLTVCGKCAEGNAVLVLENKEGVVKIPFQEIEYVEVLNKKVSFHITDGSLLESTGALSDVEGMLSGRPEFLKTHRSYLVNLSCVQEISAGFAVTRAGRVPVSRQRRGQVRTAWLQFVKQTESGSVSVSKNAAASGKARRRSGPWRILLVDDDPAQCRFWADVLRGHGCMVSTVQNGGEAVALARVESFDGVLLDVMLPGEDGFSICQRLKEETCAPVIFLSSLTEADRQMEGFAAGGIDYITKDTPAELFWTKVRTRMELAGSERSQSVYAPLLIDRTERKAYMEGEELLLTSVEFDILQLLSERAGHVFTPEEIFDTVWGEQSFDDGKTVLSAMSGLRRKLGRAWRAHSFVETVWGEGYRFVPADDDGTVKVRNS